MWAFLIPILKAMGVGAASGAGISALTGGDIKKGALMGAAGGGLGGAFGGLLGKAPIAGSAGSSAAGTEAAKAALFAPADATAKAAGLAVDASTAAVPAAKTGFSKLLSGATDAATKGAAGTMGSAAISSMIPTTGMTTPSNVPQMPINDDTMAMLEKLMQQSKMKGHN